MGWDGSPPLSGADTLAEDVLEGIAEVLTEEGVDARIDCRVAIS